MAKINSWKDQWLSRQANSFDLALDTAEKQIVHNFINAPAKNITYAPNDLVLIPNYGGPTGPLQKLATKFIGPFKIIEQKPGDIYLLKDLSADTENKFAHAATLIKLPPMSESDAIDASGTDKQEYRIKDIITSEGDPNKPSTVWITVTWQSDETSAIALPTCKHVELVRNYLLDKYPDNTSLAAYFEAAQATTGWSDLLLNYHCRLRGNCRSRCGKCSLVVSQISDFSVKSG